MESLPYLKAALTPDEPRSVDVRVNTPWTHKKKDAWDNGYDACERGFTLEHCPHEAGDEADGWRRGWHDADSAREFWHKGVKRAK